MTLADDADPRDNRAVDRTLVGRRPLGRAAADHMMAVSLALLPSVRAPRGAGSPGPIRARRGAYGWVCRLA